MLTVGVALIVMGAGAVLGWYYNVFLESLGLPWVAYIVVSTLGALVLGFAWGLVWGSLFWRVRTGHWPGPVIRRFFRERMWRKLW